MAEAIIADLDEHENWGLVWSSRVSSFVEFRDRTKHSEVEKCPRMPWWDELMEGAEKWRAYAPVAVCEVEKARAWLEKQVMPLLAMVVEADGNARWLWESLERGEQRWARQHREALIAALAA